MAYGDQVPSGVSGMSVATRVEFLDSSGRPILRRTWLGARPMEDGEFARVTQLPSIDSVDATRGAVTFTSIMDYRAGTVAHADRSTGEFTTRPIPGVLGSSGSSGWLPIAGWTSAAALVASLVGVRLWRSRQSQRHTKGGVA